MYNPNRQAHKKRLTVLFLFVYKKSQAAVR
jgi:hypothetical protein